MENRQMKTKKTNPGRNNNKSKAKPGNKSSLNYGVGGTVNTKREGNKDIPTRSKSFSKSKKRKYIYLAVAIILLAATSIIVLIWLKNSHPTTREQLEACLQTVSSKFVEEKLTQQRQCYNDYPVEESAEKIEELTTKIEETKLSQCKIKAWNSYPTEADVDAAIAANDINMVKNILVRRIQSIQTEISCYENYGKKDDSALANLYERKNENEKLLAEANNYQAYTPNYTYETPTDDSPSGYDYPTTTPEESAPPSSTMTCDDYHSQYYSDYSSQKGNLTKEYNSSISNASMECSSRGQSSCPMANNLQRELNNKISQLQNNYKNNMQSKGCNPANYVNF